MSLSIHTALLGVADAMRDKIAPSLTDSFVAEVTRLSANMVTIMANAADDAVVLRVEENARLRAVFADAAGLVPDAALSARVEEAGRSLDPGLRISALDGETSRLRGLLVDLHAALEEESGDAVREMDQRIWRLLDEIEKTRAPRI